MALYGFATKQALLRGTLTGFAKGGIYENLVAQMLVSNGYKLYYYKSGEDSEIEFVIEKDGEVVPVEVKAGNNPTKSLNGFIDRFEPSVAYKIVKGKLGMAERKYTLPHFMAMFI